MPTHVPDCKLLSIKIHQMGAPQSARCGYSFIARWQHFFIMSSNYRHKFISGGTDSEAELVGYQSCHQAQLDGEWIIG